MTVIYQPSGRAREYAEYAANLFRGCPHGCAYCFAPDTLRRTGITRYEFHREAVPRKDVIEQLRRDAERMDPVLVHLCFTCDPYPGIYNDEVDHRAITRQAIKILKENGHAVQILSKGGADSTVDFDLLGSGDEYATTLTFSNENDSRLWEPGAALPQDRIYALIIAQRYGIETWASLEPIIYPDQSLRILKDAIYAGISKIKVGPLNYKERLPRWLADTIPDVNWSEFVVQVQEMCKPFGVEVILKNDLKKLAGLA